MKASHLSIMPLLAATALTLVSQPAHANGEIDLDLGLQGTTTAWPDDHGAGGVLDASFWFLPWLGASYIGKESYSMVDQRSMTYFSLNAAFRADLGGPRLTGTIGAVHQHEEPGSAVSAMPVESLFGVGDGIRHRMAGRAGAQLAYPVWDYGRGDLFVAVDLDVTKFLDKDKGPSWQSSLGVSFGATYDFSRAKHRRVREEVVTK